MKLSIIVPAHNEQENITDVIKRIEESVDIDHELVVVNDHSNDNTAALVSKLAGVYKNIKLVENKSEKGFANALRSGFNNSSAEVVIPVMGDLCDELATIKKMFEKIYEGYDVVCASRYIEGGGRLGGSKIKGAMSCFAGRSLYYLLGIPTHDIANAYKMYRKGMLDKLDIRASGFEISMEITLKAYYQGYRITEVPTVWRERKKGKSSFKIIRLIPRYLKLYFWALIKRIRG
jgi:dolichol-phosphate mannosyltransferase